jgi:hypothetical protein
MKLRIVSDGTQAGTHVLTDTGEVVEGVQALSFTCALGDAPEALLVLQPVQCELVVDAAFTLAEQDCSFGVQDLPVTQQDLLAFLPEIPDAD